MIFVFVNASPKLITAFFFTCVLVGSVQANPTDSLANHYYSLAVSLHAKATAQQGRYHEPNPSADSAYLYAQKAAALYQNELPSVLDSASQMNLLQCYRIFISCHYWKREYAQAEQLIEETFTLVQTQYSAPEKWAHMCHLLNADYLEKRQQLEKAAEAYLKGLEIIEAYQLYPTRTLAYYYTVVGKIYLGLVNLDKAILFLQQGLRYRIEAVGPTHEWVAINHHLLANAYTNAQKNPAAEIHYQKALEIRLPIYGEEHYAIGSLYNDLGVHYWKKGKLQTASDYLERALGIYRKRLSNNHKLIAGSLNNLGLVYNRLKDYPTAIEYFLQALSIKKTYLPPDAPALSLAHANLAVSYYRNREKEAGLSQIDTAIHILFPAFHLDSLDNLEVKPLSQSLQVPLDQTLVFWGLLLSDVGDPTQEDLLKADRVQQFLIELISDRLRDYRFDLARTVQQSTANSVYLSNFNTLYQLHAQTGDPIYSDRMYELYEKAKAYLLRKKMQEENIFHLGGVPKALVNKVDSLEQELIRNEQKNNARVSSPQPTPGDSITLASLALSNQLDSLRNHIERYYPVFRKLKSIEPIVPLAQVKEALSKNEAIFAIWNGHRHRLGVNFLVIHPKGIKFYQHAPNDSIRAELLSFKRLITESDFSPDKFKEFTNAGHRYFTLFLEEPLKYLQKTGEEVQKLTIITDGYFNNLPFELLLTQMPDTSVVDYRNLPYLFREYTLNYAQSISMWYNQMQAVPKSNHAYVGFAPTYDYEALASSEALSEFEEFRSNPGKLQSIYEEVSFAQQLFGGNAFLKQNAHETNFKQKIGDPSILHLAMHALTDIQNPYQSKLIFSMNPEGEDGFLHAYEIYAMKIRTQLAVLSACETNKGLSTDGEGIYSLARAFTFAGCPSIVTSHWQVNDKYTTAQMKLFFQHIHAGLGKTEALQKAKLDYLETTDEAGTHPANWAAFIHLGNDLPVVLQHSWRWPLLGIAFLQTLLLIGIWGVRRKT